MSELGDAVKKRAAEKRVKVEEMIADILSYIGCDPKLIPGVEETPARFLRALEEMTSGYGVEPKDILAKQFDEKSDEMVILTNIEFTSVCEHHVLPFTGSADVGYLPGPKGKVVGLSKLARLVDCFAKRFQLQERMTREIATSLMTCLEAKGAAVVVRAHHSCMGCRGVKKPDAVMVTSAMLGLFREEPEARAEFLALCESAR